MIQISGNIILALTFSNVASSMWEWPKWSARMKIKQKTSWYIFMHIHMTSPVWQSTLAHLLPRLQQPAQPWGRFPCPYQTAAEERNTADIHLYKLASCSSTTSCKHTFQWSRCRYKPPTSSSAHSLRLTVCDGRQNCWQTPLLKCTVSDCSELSWGR